MIIKIKNMNKKPLKISVGSTLACAATLVSSLFTIGATNLNGDLAPAYVTYLENHWNWNDKLKPKVDRTTWANTWASVRNVYKNKIPFMTNDYTVSQSGIAKSHKFDHQFISAFANFGFLIGTAYRSGQSPVFSGPCAYYFYYPLLEISQADLIDGDFVFTNPKPNDELIIMFDSNNPSNPKFHYSVELTGTTTNTPADQTTVTIKKYDDGTSKTYTQAVINATPTKENPVTTYTPTPKPTPNVIDPLVMKGSDFTVIVTKGTDSLNNLIVPPVIGTYHTHTDSYALRNMFAFFLSETNSNNITTQQLLGVDTAGLINGTETIINSNSLDYVAQYNADAENTKASWSTEAIVGTIVSAAALLAFIIGLGIWLYKRQQQQTIATNK